MTDLLTIFRERCHELADLRSSLSTLQWDQETMMPPKAGTFRARQMSTLAALLHQRLTDPAIGDLLSELESRRLPLWEAASVRELRRQYRKATRLPRTLVRELAATGSLAYEEWVQARQESDFGRFAPWLDKMMSLKREEARCLQDGNTLYEALLDEYEPGMSEAELDRIFQQVQPVLTRLAARIQDSPAARQVSAINGDFPPAQQTEFGRRVVTEMGFDWMAGRLDISPHPFCSGLTPLDVRITTRYSSRDFTNSLFGMMHEAGHALYEQGLAFEYFGLPACDTISLGIHESQSRLWENQVGRSRAFWNYWFPELKRVFAGQLDSLSLDAFVRSVNRVTPSLIRVDADEVTYGLHIILRFGLEKALIQNEVSISDLPEIWRFRMQEFLGIIPAGDAEGVLQDTHWSQGLVGYFPTYLLGNLYAAQLFDQARRQLNGLEAEIAAGRLLPLRDWLKQAVHRHGKTRSAAELIHEISGRPLESRFFLDYLETKFESIYEL